MHIKRRSGRMVGADCLQRLDIYAIYGPSLQHTCGHVSHAHREARQRANTARSFAPHQRGVGPPPAAAAVSRCAI